MIWRALRQRLETLPPVLIDASLALILGLVGAVQLASQRQPFGGFRPPPGQGTSPISGTSPFEAAPTIFAQRPGGPEPADALTYLLLGLCAGSLVARRRYPVAALGGVTLFGFLFLMSDQPAFAIQLIVLVAIYSVVADSGLSRLASIAISVEAAGLLALAILLSDVPRRDSVWAMDAAWVVAAIFLGDSSRSRRQYALAAERGREEEARRRVSEERLQIARELHDVVGHSIALINVQAGAGTHVLYKDPEQARETFANIRQASHETLDELRSMVGVLRQPMADEPRTPTAGLDELDQLVKAVIDAGQTVELKVTGKKRDLTGVVDLSAYRILQEALTNTVRHAPKASVKVMLDYQDDRVTVEVVNTRGQEPGPRQPGGGHGLVGMRERVAAIGGQIETGRTSDGGFRVRAVLPVLAS